MRPGIPGELSKLPKGRGDAHLANTKIVKMYLRKCILTNLTFFNSDFFIFLLSFCNLIHRILHISIPRKKQNAHRKRAAADKNTRISGKKVNGKIPLLSC